MKYFILLIVLFVLSACLVDTPPDTSHSYIVTIDEKQAKNCTPVSRDINGSHSHEFHEDNNMLRLIEEAKEKVAKKKGNALLVKSLQMDYQSNKATIIYQAFSCPQT